MEIIKNPLSPNRIAVIDKEEKTALELILKNAGVTNELIEFVDVTDGKINYLLNDGLKKEMTVKFAEMWKTGELIEIAGEAIEVVGNRLDQLERKEYKTVTDLRLDGDLLEEGQTLKTLGYYNEGDGGACEYVVVQKEKSYDIPLTSTIAARPIHKSSTINLKQFGTKNEFEVSDNQFLQRAFDYAKDYNIDEIDGQNLVYNVDSSTKIHSNYNGIQIHQPVKLKNATFKSFLNIAQKTSCLDIVLAKTDKDYLLENVHFIGNYGHVNYTGAEDGGCHCLSMTFKDNRFPNEFLPSSNVTIKNCTFTKPDGYGIFSSASDCTLTVDGCTFDTNGPCVLTYATNCIIKNCKATMNNSYKPMEKNFCHDEIEFGNNYNGTKRKSILIENCDMTGIFGRYGSFLYKIHAITQRGVHYDKVIIRNSRTSANIFEQYETEDTKKTKFNDLVIDNVTSELSSNIRLENARVEKFYVNSNFYSKGIIEFSSCEVPSFQVKNKLYNATSYIKLNKSCYISDMLLESLLVDDLGSYYVLGCDDPTLGNISRMTVRDMVSTAPQRHFYGAFLKVIMNNLTINASDIILLGNGSITPAKFYSVTNCNFIGAVPDDKFLISNASPSSGVLLVANCTYGHRIECYANGMSVKMNNNYNWYL